MENKLTEKQMNMLILSIKEDLANAKHYLDYYKDLKNLLFNKYPKVLTNYGTTFWQYTLQSFYFAMQVFLMRAYDQSSDTGAIGLRLLLIRINENLELFSDELFKKRMIQKNFSEKDVDILLGNREKESDFKEKHKNNINKINSKNDIVKRLIIIRNSGAIHKNEKILYAIKERFVKTIVTLEEIDNLINDGLSIINYYANHYDQTHHMAYVVGN